MQKITVGLNDSTVDQLNEVLKLVNLNNRYYGTCKRDDYSIEDFIKSSVKFYLEKYQTFYNYYHPLEQLKGKNIKIRNKFKEVMNKKGIKQKELVELIGIDRVNVSKVLNNNIQPRSDTFFKYWVALDCPPIEECVEIVEED